MFSFSPLRFPLNLFFQAGPLRHTQIIATDALSSSNLPCVRLMASALVREHDSRLSAICSHWTPLDVDSAFCTSAQSEMPGRFFPLYTDVHFFMTGLRHWHLLTSLRSGRVTPPRIHTLPSRPLPNVVVSNSQNGAFELPFTFFPLLSQRGQLFFFPQFYKG